MGHKGHTEVRDVKKICVRHRGHALATETVRTHVVLPKELVEAVDDLVGQRKRSAFVADAIEEKVQRERLGRALKETAGILRGEDYPEWETPEMVSAWVRKLRAVDQEHTERNIVRLHQP